LRDAYRTIRLGVSSNYMNTFDDYQKAAETTAIYSKKTALEYLSLGLASEAGEVAGHIAKYYRSDRPYPMEDILAECGDVLWFISELARIHNKPLSELAAENIAKLQSRKQRGKLKGNGDKR